MNEDDVINVWSLKALIIKWCINIFICNDDDDDDDDDDDYKKI
jgi:hypothetical protein